MDNIRVGEDISASTQAGMGYCPAGFTYHIDPEINHGIDNLICSLGGVVVTEDSIGGNIKSLIPPC